MRKALPLLGAAVLVSLLVCLNGCIIETTEITITITDFVCTEFVEDHDSENYMDDTVAIGYDFFAELDALLDENDMDKEDVAEVSVIGAFYQITDGPTNPPWTVSGRIYVQVNDDDAVLIADYPSKVLTGEVMDEPERIRTFDAGLAVLNAALETYRTATDTLDYPTIVFHSDHEAGDIDPSPGPEPHEQFHMTWNGCLSMRVDFTEPYDIYDMFPGE